MKRALFIQISADGGNIPVDIEDLGVDLLGFRPQITAPRVGSSTSEGTN